MPPAHRLIAAAALIALSGALVSCATPHDAARPRTAAAQPARPKIAPPTLTETRPLDYPGIHNAVAYHDGFISGSAPEGDVGFQTLAEMGVKTIISVDGAAPDADKAAALGIRYIHLPIGYNGFDEQRKLELVRATRDAMNDGSVYIHCHHGKHRSAGAAATIAASLGWGTPQDETERMKVSGTAPEYRGLFACAANASVVDASAIDAVPGNFPAIARPTGFVKGMVEIDETFEHLKAIERAGWTTPKHHPDLVPAAEAGRLADLFRVISESRYAADKPADFAGMLRDTGARAQRLETLFTSGQNGGENAAMLANQLKLVAASCKDCHAKYRD